VRYGKTPDVTPSAEIADGIGVSATTVRKRTARRKESDLIRGYASTVDYELAGFRSRIVFAE
jgi:DNA-binding Lrp family transcriptional regulator